VLLRTIILELLLKDMVVFTQQFEVIQNVLDILALALKLSLIQDTLEQI